MFKKELKSQNGIYFLGNSGNISFPEEAYASCYQIEDASYWFSHRLKIIIELYKRFASQKTFVDLGGGNGFIAKGIQDQGYHTILVEPGINGCINAKSRGVNEVVCGTFSSENILPNTVPSVGCFDVIEHIENPLTFLTTIYEALEPGGVLFVTVPAYRFLWSSEDELAGHYRRYTKSRIWKEAKACGFKRLYSTYLFSFLVIPILLFRSIPDFFKSKPKSATNPEKDHVVEGGLIGTSLNWLMNQESKKISRGGSKWFGSSVVIVLQK